MLIETQGSNTAHDEEKMTKFLTDVMDEGIVKNGVVTNEPSKMKVSINTNNNKDLNFIFKNLNYFFCSLIFF